MSATPLSCRSCSRSLRPRHFLHCFSLTVSLQKMLQNAVSFFRIAPAPLDFVRRRSTASTRHCRNRQEIRSRIELRSISSSAWRQTGAGCRLRSDRCVRTWRQRKRNRRRCCWTRRSSRSPYRASRQRAANAATAGSSSHCGSRHCCRAERSDSTEGIEYVRTKCCFATAAASCARSCTLTIACRSHCGRRTLTSLSSPCSSISFNSEYDQNQRKHDARNAACARLAHGDQLACRVSLIVQIAAASAADLSDIDEALRFGEPVIAFEHEHRVAFADVHRTSGRKLSSTSSSTLP